MKSSQYLVTTANKTTYRFWKFLDSLPVLPAFKGYRKGNLWPVILLLLLYADNVSAQDPVLPPTNLGSGNVFDGVAGKPGFVYQTFVQVFHTRKIIGDRGQDMHSGLKVNSLVQVNQLIYLTPVKVFGGNLAFTVLIPIVQIHASNATGPAPASNPNVLGDLTQGTAVQWSGKKLFGKPFSHRMELDVTLPVGNYEDKYSINASAHVYTFSTYHAFTLMLSDKVSVSSRNQLNYNTHIIGQKAKAGAFYNGNHSIDLALFPNLRIEVVAYFLSQLNSDSYDGNKNYYQQQFGTNNTKERVLGYGPGLAYFAKGGTLIEVKTFFETAVRNRVAGYRSTLRITIPLN